MELATVSDLENCKREIVSHFKRSMEALVTCGGLLFAVKSALNNDASFRGFCKGLPFTYRSAYNYIRLYEHSVSVGVDAILAAKVDATAWYSLPVDSKAATIAIEAAKQGKDIKKDTARLIVQTMGIENTQSAQVLERVAEQNPKHFVSMIERGVVTDPVSGDDIPLSAADATMIAYSADTDESERIKRQRQHIENSKQSRYANTVTFFVDTKPIPKQRPRLGKNGVFTPQRTKDYEDTVGWAARAAMGQISTFTGDCVFSATFYRTGKRRADLDNLIKAVKDGINGIVYEDDKQVIEYGRTRVIYDADKDGVEVTVSELKQQIMQSAA